MLLILLIGGSCLFFLIFVQPIWGIVDVATSKEHSGGTKAAVILLTLLLLGPIMTFFYAWIGTRSRVFRASTLICFIVLVLCGGSLLGLAIAVPALQQRLPWHTTTAGNAKPAVTTTAGPPATHEVENPQILEFKSRLSEAIRTKNADAFVDCFYIEERFNTPEIRQENRTQIEILLKGETIEVEIGEIPAKELSEIKKIQKATPNSPFRYSLNPRMLLRIWHEAQNGRGGRSFLIGEKNGKWYIITMAGHTT